MKEAKFDLKDALRRRLNWGKGELAQTVELDSDDLITLFDNRIKSLKNKVCYRDKVIAQMHTDISDHKAVIEGQEATITTQEKRIKELEAQVAKLKSTPQGGSTSNVRLTSNNSSTPPSKNPIGVKQTRSLREKSNNPVGGQTGHDGSTREWHSSPDSVERCQAPTLCPNCGADITGIESQEGERRQMVDIPAIVVPLIKEYVQMQRKCTCGKCVKGEFPKEVSGRVCFSPRIDATVSYLSAQQTIPFARLTHMMRSLFGVTMSGGTISNILKRMRKRAQHSYEQIRKVVEQSAVVGADESGVNINGKNHWMWTFQTEMANYLAVDKSRAGRVVTEHFPDGFAHSTLVSDRLALYFKVESADHQICLAHLLRNTLYIQEVLAGNSWAGKMLELLREAIHYRKSRGCDQGASRDFRARLDELLDGDYKQRSKSKQELFEKFRRGIGKHRDHIFTFLMNESVPYDNNASERSVRPVKTKLKVSGQFKSSEGAQQYATLQSIIQTAHKNGRDPLCALIALAEVGAE